MAFAELARERHPAGALGAGGELGSEDGLARAAQARERPVRRGAGARRGTLRTPRAGCRDPRDRAGRRRCPGGTGSRAVQLSGASTCPQRAPDASDWSPAGEASTNGTPPRPNRLCTYVVQPHMPYCAPAGTRNQRSRACRETDHVEVDLAVGDAAALGDGPEGREHRCCDEQVRHEELGVRVREDRRTQDLPVPRWRPIWPISGWISTRWPSTE